MSETGLNLKAKKTPMEIWDNAALHGNVQAADGVNFLIVTDTFVPPEVFAQSVSYFAQYYDALLKSFKEAQK